MAESADDANAADPPRQLPTRIIWRPQAGPQHALMECPCAEVFMGGARGGGKTDGVLGKWAVKDQYYGEHFNAVGLRMTAVSWDDAIERSRAIFAPLGGVFNEAKLTWRMPRGGRVRFAHLETVKDASNYQGKNVTDVWIEEVGLYPTENDPRFLPAPIARMKAVMRSAQRVPVQMVLTGNPGGAGQQWCATRYQLIPFPVGPKLVKVLSAAGRESTAAVIPSRLENNRLLMEADPDYEGRLMESGSTALVKAWRYGDWSTVEGAYFDCWDGAKHVVQPFAIPSHWIRFTAMDWGFASPFAIYWIAVASDDTVAGSVRLPRGCLVVYREWYGQGGARLDAQRIAAGMLEREAAAGERRGVEDYEDTSRPSIAYGVLDPSCWDVSRGPSIAEQMARSGVIQRQADNRRTRLSGAISGWDQVRRRLVGDEAGNPMLVFFAGCEHAIRTIPVLQHDQKNAEDVDTDMEDHAADAVRYGCMSRPWTRELPVVEPPRRIVVEAPGVTEKSTITLDDLWAEEARLRGLQSRI